MPILRMPTCEAPEYEGVLSASGSDKQTVKDDQMRSTSSKSKIAADEPARKPPGAVTQSAIAHAENATRTRVAFFLWLEALSLQSPHNRVGANRQLNSAKSLGTFK
jgi:hypothetical protein